MLRTMPPRTIVMATGSPGGAYFDFGERYRAALASAGVEVRVVPTAGSQENLALLLDPHSGVSVGLIQGGTVGADESSKLESLGTVFYEPLWLFRKRGSGNRGLADDLRGRRISIGPVGSGTRVLSLELLKRNRIDGQVSELLALASDAAGEKLSSGEIDAALIAGPAKSEAKWLPVKLVDRTLLMCHQHPPGALVELQQIGKTASGADGVLHDPPEAFDGVEVVPTMGR